MKFLLMTPADENAKPEAPPDPKLMAALGKLGAEFTQSGVLLESGGMSSKAMRLELAGGEIRVTDGPYTEAKEMVGGYAIVEVGSQAEAVELARRFLQAHRDTLGPSYKAESLIRRLYSPAGIAPPSTGR